MTTVKSIETKNCMIELIKVTDANFVVVWTKPDKVIESVPFDNLKEASETFDRWHDISRRG